MRLDEIDLRKATGFHYPLLVLFLLIAFIICGRALAAPPLLNFEGVGGGGIVPGAYLVNPPPKGKWIGKPAVSSWNLIGGDSNVYTQGIAISMFNRIEVGYAFEIYDFSRLRHDVKKRSGGTLDPKKDTIYQHDFHIKLLLVNEKKYIPAFAVTTEFKFNDTIDKINDNLGKPLNTIGYNDDSGVDFDFSFSKTFLNLIPYPLQAHFNLRLTKGNQTGFLGFSEDYTINSEISIGAMLRSDIIAGFEYRQKPDEYDSLERALSGFTFKEDDFWDIFLGYLPNEKLSFAAAFCRYGNEANKDVNYFVFNVKYDL